MIITSIQIAFVLYQCFWFLKFLYLFLLIIFLALHVQKFVKINLEFVVQISTILLRLTILLKFWKIFLYHLLGWCFHFHTLYTISLLNLLFLIRIQMLLSFNLSVVNSVEWWFGGQANAIYWIPLVFKKFAWGGDLGVFFGNWG